MSQISEVLKNRNRAKRLREERRKEELQRLKEESIFKVLLKKELEYVDFLLDSGEVDRVLIEVPEKYLARFGIAIYKEDLLDYSIKQHSEKANVFYISKKVIDF